MNSIRKIYSTYKRRIVITMTGIVRILLTWLSSFNRKFGRKKKIIKKRIAVYDPGFRGFGHNIYFNIHVLKLFSYIFEEVYYFDFDKIIKKEFRNAPRNVKIVQLPFIINDEKYSYKDLWEYIDSYKCDLVFLTSEERHDGKSKRLYTTPPGIPYIVLIHIVWQMLRRLNTFNKTEIVLKNALALFVFEDYLMEPLVGKNTHIFRFPYFVFNDNFKVGGKKENPRLKIGTIGFINERRNVDFILETLMNYSGEPLEYYLFGKPLGETGKKIEKMVMELSFPVNVKLSVRFDYLTDKEYRRISKECDFILIAYDEKRRYQTPGVLYQFSNQNTTLIVPKIEPFVTIEKYYENMFVFYDNLSSISLNKLLSVLAKKGKEYKNFKKKAAVAREKFAAMNKEGIQLKYLEDTMRVIIKKIGIKRRAK